MSLKSFDPWVFLKIGMALQEFTCVFRKQTAAKELGNPTYVIEFQD
jgi:hypothetical protein